MKRIIFKIKIFLLLPFSLAIMTIAVSGQSIQYAYDSLNRLAEVRYTDRVIRYTYDAAGNRTSMTVENLAAVPSISGLNPSGVDAGTSGFTLIVSGSNFTNTSVVRWNGTNYATVYVNANQIRANIPASEISSAGTASVTIVNAAPNSVSNAKNFSINLPPTAAIGIGGRVSLNGSGLSGATVVLTGANNTYNQTTDANGEFNFTGLQPGVYTIKPSKLNYTFSPPTRTILYLGGDSQENNFVAAIAQQPGRATFDFDGDGKSDLGFFSLSDDSWHLSGGLSGEMSRQFGTAGDSLVPADYDGDGVTDFAFYRKRIWTYLQSSDGTIKTRLLGWKGDTPQPCDFDGDRRADFITFGDGIWSVRQSSDNAIQIIKFGSEGDIPVSGDYSGDNRCELAVYTSSDSTWTIRDATGEIKSVRFGEAGDKPVPGDFDGDRKINLAVFRPSDGTWYISAGANYKKIKFGNSSSIPVPSDYDGDGIADLAIYQNGIWNIFQSANGLLTIRFGDSADKPINILPEP